jgi:peptidoglycan-associated lipoprotein
MMHSKLLYGLCALAMVGCAATQEKHGDTGMADIKRQLAEEAEALYAGDTSIIIDPEIAAKCKMPTAHFDFDSEYINLKDSPALDHLAACFTNGPLKGETLLLVGHADPRGELSYNFGLGQARAGSVATYLGLAGLGDDHVITSSLGELEAVGTDHPSWARDRKVEVLLAE